MPPKIIDVKAFLEATGNKPNFTRALIQNAANQLKKAKQGQSFELSDCYGKVHTFESDTSSDKRPTLIYNNYHSMADDKPWEALHKMPMNFQQKTSRGCGDDLDEMVPNAKLPIYVHLKNVKKTNQEYDLTDLKERMMAVTKAWQESSEREAVLKSLAAMANNVPITNIICFGNGSIAFRPEAANQHVFAADLAVQLTRIYNEAGIEVGPPIKIYAQEPAYSSVDVDILSDKNIEVLEDPEAFLVINSGSLILACAPTVPVKQIVADLAMEDPSTCPAAVMWDNNSRDNLLGLDRVSYKMETYVYFSNPTSQRCLDMMTGWTKVFDGEGQLGSVYTGKNEEDWSLGTKWLSHMEFWARPAGSSDV